MAKQSTSTVNALNFLLQPPAGLATPVCIIAGDDGFLQHETRRSLLKQLCGDDPQAARVYSGATVELRDVLDNLTELSLFDEQRRVVVVEGADPFVKQFRGQLEDYVAKPCNDATLILEVSAWPGNTRLAKAVAASGRVIRCSIPDKGREVTEFNKQLKQWLAEQVRREYDCELVKAAGDRLLELLPSQPGVLLQETARLALLAGDAKRIDVTLVSSNVGGWRTRKTWDMIDAAADGRAADALGQLDRLIAAGEEPHALLPQMASTLRRFAMAARVFAQAERIKQRTSLRSALQQAGAPPFKIGDMERQLRQIGRERALDLSHWLLAADLELKGHNSTKERARRVIETLIVRLSKQMQPIQPTAGRR